MCGARSAVKSTHMQVWPRVLVLHLKRFTPTLNGYRKIHAVVEVGDTFEIGGERFCVLAKVNHIGRKMDSGHYTADIKLGKWKHCNDSIISNYRAEDRSREVYLVFAEKV